MLKRTLYVNPATGDYEKLANGKLKVTSPAEQSIVNRLYVAKTPFDFEYGTGNLYNGKITNKMVALFLEDIKDKVLKPIVAEGNILDNYTVSCTDFAPNSLTISIQATDISNQQIYLNKVYNYGN